MTHVVSWTSQTALPPFASGKLTVVQLRAFNGYSGSDLDPKSNSTPECVKQNRRQTKRAANKSWGK
jgi:hypothetical protein